MAPRWVCCAAISLDVDRVLQVLHGMEVVIVRRLRSANSKMIQAVALVCQGLLWECGDYVGDSCAAALPAGRTPMVVLMTTLSSVAQLFSLKTMQMEDYTVPRA